MRRAALIYNPASGQYSARRDRALGEVLQVFREAGVAAEAFETGAPGSATALAERVKREGFDSVVACGGDGTVHEVVQSLVGTEVALGVFPLGTANALASDLGLIGRPDKVAHSLLNATPTRVSVGRIHYRDRDGNPASRYFIVAAGIGADALLMSRMDSRLKRRLGYVLYLVEGLRIWVADTLPFFQATVIANGNGTARVKEVSQLLAVRVRSFGGALGELAPGASLRNGSLNLLTFATRSRLRYLKFFGAVLAGRQTFSREIELVEASSVECRACDGSTRPIFVEADGEVLGSLPVRLEVAPHPLMLLVPDGVQP